MGLSDKTNVVYAKGNEIHQGTYLADLLTPRMEALLALAGRLDTAVISDDDSTSKILKKLAKEELNERVAADSPAQP